MASTSSSAAAAKKPCLNDSRLTYTGKESSPRGLGYCAEAEAVGTIKEGRDDKRWMVVIKNNVNVWTRIPEDASVFAKKESRPHPEITPAEDETPAAPPAAPKKKPAAPKKKPAAAAKPAAEPAPEPEKPAAEPEKPAAESPAAEPPAAKKPAAKKPAAEAEKPTAAAAAKKPPTDFNLYIKYRLAQLKTLEPEMTHAQRFSQAAKDWGTLSPEQKATEIAAARAEFA